MIGKANWSEARREREAKREYNNVGWQNEGATKRRERKAKRRKSWRLAVRKGRSGWKGRRRR